METATTHEARARNAKAHALAEILHQHKATVANVRQIPATGWGSWETVATLATERELLGRTKSGKVRQVHVPGYGSGDAAATIDAVARILGDLIAHENDQAAIAERETGEQVHPAASDIVAASILRGLGANNAAACVESTRTMTAHGEACDHCGALVDGPFVGLSADEVDALTDEQRAEHLETAGCNGRAYQVNPDEPSEGIDIHHDRYCPAHPDVRWGEPVRPKNLRAQALFDESIAAARRPTDSGEYRRTVRALDPETARAFAAFGGADR